MEFAFAVAVLLLLSVLVLLALRKPAVDLGPVQARLDAIERAGERLDRCVREEIGRNREEAGREAREFRSEIQNALAQLRQTLDERLHSGNELLVRHMSELNRIQQEHTASDAGQLSAMRGVLEQRLDALRASIEQRLDAVRNTVEGRLQALQAENASKLDQIRRTVDEQLQDTLEKRLGESFRMVSERLEQVHRGLGEMQNLASGVGDLKKVLTNVRARGAWGEVQLGMLLEQMLSREQYQKNVATTGSDERVEFAIKLPGPEPDTCVWLPIDAKFPKEDYERLLDAVDRADPEAIEACSRQLEARARQCARDIAQKYVAPPRTTDFAVMYLATEGLYAEVLRRPGLVESLQREFRVTVAGPTTLAAFLNSLQMGFRTLAIQQKSSEVWEVLGAVKTEFGKYSDILTKVQKKLQEAANTVDAGLTRTRQIVRKLRDVQELPAPAAEALLGPPEEEAEAFTVGPPVLQDRD